MNLWLFFILFFLVFSSCILVAIFALLYRFYRYFEANGSRWRNDRRVDSEFIYKAIKDFHGDCINNGFQITLVCDKNCRKAGESDDD